MNSLKVTVSNVLSPFNFSETHDAESGSRGAQVCRQDLIEITSCPKECIVHTHITTYVPLLLKLGDGRAEDLEVAALMWNECGVY